MDNKSISLIVGGLSLFLLVRNNYIYIPEARAEFNSIYKFYASKIVPAELLRAVAIVESGENTLAYNPNDPSYGLMQILFTGSNKLYVDGWPPNSFHDLYEPNYNVKIGSQILNWNIKKYGLFRGIISYNNWSAREGFLPMKSLKYFMRVYITYIRLRGGNE